MGLLASQEACAGFVSWCSIQAESGVTRVRGGSVGVSPPKRRQNAVHGGTRHEGSRRDREPRPTALEGAYQVFRLERQGNLVAPRTLEFYDRLVGESIAWLHSEAPTVERVEDVGVNHLRAFRAFMTERRRPDGQPFQAATLHASHRAIHTFLAWAELDGYGVDGRMLRLPPPRRPHKEATVFHVTQLRAILRPASVRRRRLRYRLVGFGLRISQLSGSPCAAPMGSPT